MSRRMLRRAVDLPIIGGVTTTSTPWLPFDMPTQSNFDNSNVIVAPHAMATWRRAIQDKNIETDSTSYEQQNWVPPGGIEGAGQSWATDHRVWGGFVRNMPKGRNPYGTTDWEVRDKRWELQQLKAAGMSHMIIDMLGNDTFDHVKQWGQAASLEGLPRSIIAMPDGSTGLVRDGPTNLRDKLLELFTGPYANSWAKHTDGRWLVMPYAPEYAAGDSATEQQVITYWTQAMQLMEAAGQPCALWCCFTAAWLTSSENTALTFTKPALSSWVVGLGRWGTGNPDETNNTNIHNAGSPDYSHNTFNKPFVYSVRTEDSRPRSGVFFEAGGWDNLVSAANIMTTRTSPQTWGDIIQLATWNDWFEQSGFAPSIYHGWSTLDAISYWVCQQRLGYTPPIIRDTIYLAHRVHFGPSGGTTTYTAGSVYTSRMSRFGSTAERNVVDVLVFAVTAGTLEITTGGGTTSHSVPAGVSRVSVPLSVGSVSCVMKRLGVSVTGTSITSPWNVSNTQLVQDMSYRRISSRR